MCGGGDDVYKPEFKYEVVDDVLKRGKSSINQKEIKITIKEDEKRED